MDKSAQEKHSVDRLQILGEMAATIVHEISQPILGIQLAAEMGQRRLKKGEEPENLETVFADILNLSKRSQELIQKIRRYSLQNDENTSRHVSLSNCFNNVLSLVKFQMERYKIKIDTDINQTLCVHADSLKLEQVIVNLLNNAKDAILHTEQEGKIQIIAKSENGVVQMRIQDNGVGIPEDKQKEIFKAFYSTKKSHDGTGLGLSISKQIITSMGGKLQLESSSSDGSTFSIHLPISSEEGQ